ncbi:tetratricopeptide repeat protein [Calycomorphotria hydatis]|uniref:tetratricopeptide repeat protein n=1 Tax=Calycomorphotria hydatis TaxID=2528027 RepID=UPI0011A406A6|nr:hypothetical protein [Calycomorphotria hydatis]
MERIFQAASALNSFSVPPDFVFHSTLRIICCLAVCLAVSAAHAQSVTSAYFDGLRARGMFQLAESVALQRLSSNEMSEDERAEFVLELSRTLTAHAPHTAGDEQSDLYSRAHAVLNDFLKTFTGSSWKYTFELQHAIVDWSHATTLSWEAELSNRLEAESSQIEQLLRAAEQRLIPLETELQTLKRTRRRDSDSDDITSATASDLAQASALLLAKIWLERSRLASPGSQRPRAIEQAEAWLSKSKKGLVRNAVVRESLLLLAEAARLKGDGAQVRRYLADMPMVDMTRGDHDFMTAISTRLLLDENKADKAAELLLNYRKQSGSLTGELLLLKIRSLQQLQKEAHQHKATDLINDLQKQIDFAVEQATAEVGGVWAYRCRLASQLTSPSDTGGSVVRGELAEVIQRAEAKFAANNFDGALAEYALAIDVALRDNELNTATELGFTRASILLQQKRLQDAVDGFLKAADYAPKSPRAAEAHLMAAWGIGRLAQSDAKLTQRYLETLTTHRKRFRKQKTYSEATWMLANAAEGRRPDKEVEQLYAELTGDQQHGAAARLALVRLTEKHEKRTLEAIGSDLNVLIKAVGQLPRRSDDWTQADAEFLLRATRHILDLGILEDRDASRLDRAMTQLQKAISKQQRSRNNKDKKFWNEAETAAYDLSVRLLVAEGKMSEAQRLIERQPTTSTATSLAIIKQVGIFPRGVDSTQLRKRGELILIIGEPLIADSSKWPRAEQAAFNEILAQAYSATGQSEKGVELLRTEASQPGVSPERQQDLATQLTAINSNASLEAAITIWQRLAKSHPACSEERFEANYRQAQLLLKLGREKEANRIKTVLGLLCPSFNTSDWNGKFSELMK